MAYTDGNLPFKRGETYFGSNTPEIGTSDSALEGRQFIVEDIVNGKGRAVTLQIVRNTSGITLQPKRIVTYQAGYEGARVDGYSRLTAAKVAGVVDDYYSTSAQTIAANDLFYIVVRGPVKIKTDLAGSVNNNLSVGSELVALTAATSGATTAGRIGLFDATTTAAVASQILNVFGTALTAQTTGQTNSDVLVMSHFRP